MLLLLSWTVTLFTPRVSADTVEINVPDRLRDRDTYCLPVVRLFTVITKEEFALTPLVVTFSLVFAERCLRPMIDRNKGEYHLIDDTPHIIRTSTQSSYQL